VEQDRSLAEHLEPHHPARKQIAEAMKERFQTAQAPFHLAAEVLCDMHDTPVRMIAKGAIRAIVPWREARAFFFWELKKQLIVFNIRQQLRAQKPGMSLDHATREVLSWYPQTAPQDPHHHAQGFVTWSQSEAGFKTIGAKLRSDRLPFAQ